MGWRNLINAVSEASPTVGLSYQVILARFKSHSFLASSNF